MYPWDTRRPPGGNLALQSMGLCLVDLVIPQYPCDQKLCTRRQIKSKKRARQFEPPLRVLVQRLRVGQLDRDKLSRRQMRPLWLGEHLPPIDYTQENLYGLTKKVGTLGLQVTRKNRCGASNKRARRARLAEAPTGDSDLVHPGLF